MVERVLLARSVSQVVVAVPPGDERDLLGSIPEPAVIYAPDCPENDLVLRHLRTAQTFNADIVVRIPSDNPCVDPAYIDKVVSKFVHDNLPIVTNTTDYVALDKRYVFLDGIGAEVYSRSTFEWLDTVLKRLPHREHPHKVFYEANVLKLPRADYRIDVNDQADYELIKGLYERLPRHFTAMDIATCLQG